MRGARGTRIEQRREARSLHWWKIMADNSPDNLMFRDFYQHQIEPDSDVDRDTDLLAGNIESPDLWGDDSSLIEDWFAAGDELDGVDDWRPWLGESWEEGVVLRQPRMPGRLELRRVD